MAREEEIKDAGIRLFGNVSKDINRAFELGAQWADTFPKSPWISVEERLPEVRDGYKGFSKNVLVLYRDQETGMSYITEAYYDFEYKGDGGWVLANNDDEHFFYSDYQENGYIVTHWMCIPELKKGE